MRLSLSWREERWSNGIGGDGESGVRIDGTNSVKETISACCMVFLFTVNELNTDGVSLGNPGVAGYGGVVRDKSGNWVAGFARRIGITSSFKTELWRLWNGLTLCSNLNISALIVELDAKVIVDIFHNANYEKNIVSPILDDCRQLFSKFGRVQIKHIYCQANRCADTLARMVAE